MAPKTSPGHQEPRRTEPRPVRAEPSKAGVGGAAKRKQQQWCPIADQREAGRPTKNLGGAGGGRKPKRNL